MKSSDVKCVTNPIEYENAMDMIDELLDDGDEMNYHEVERLQDLISDI